LGIEEIDSRPAPETAPLHIFYKYNANDPTDDKSTWVLGHLYEMIGQRTLPLPPMSRAPILKNVFRRDIFQRAKVAVFDQTQALMAEAQNFEAEPKTPERFDKTE